MVRLRYLANYSEHAGAVDSQQRLPLTAISVNELEKKIPPRPTHSPGAQIAIHYPWAVFFMP